MALFAERDLSVPLPARFLQLSRHEQQVVSDHEFSMQQPWLRSPIQCTEAAADVEAINFSVEEVNYVREKSEIVCNK